MRIISVNIAHPRANEWKQDVEFTGIDKRPVAGPVAVRAAGPKPSGEVGLAGDRVGDLKHHGGTDQAVYAYAREDYDRFESVLGRKLPDGGFGENLTVTGHDLSAARIGERWSGPGGLVLEVTGPRIPCGTFRGWIGERGWLKTFTAEARPGAYLRVAAPGEVAAGAELEVVDRPEHKITVEALFRANMGDRDAALELLRSPHLDESEAADLRKAHGLD
ncbi:MOSC domain-containing protein [Glycomyces xiaoerkulensis]|uniref:MOSC domain-containing protein n=1 Tax=Glycomyces xiaoerkulensis TaxID=2038139 RepID=UPI000C25E8FB|nr:MOSC domain-containing protein [Glycomyces xiaoerkulensis]